MIYQLAGAAILFISYKVGEYFYPGILKKKLMRSSWNTLELYSRVEIYVSKLYNHYSAYLPQFFVRKPQPTVTFIHNGDEIVKYTDVELIYYSVNNKIDFKYDFVLYETPIKNVSKYDKYDNYVERYEKHQDLPHVNFYSMLNSPTSNIYNANKTFELNMIQFTFKNSSNVYAIDLGRNQFTNRGNILFDRPFLKWYLKKYKQVKLNDDDKYTVTFIDHDMNYIILPHYCYILINKNGYDIINVIDDDDTVGADTVGEDTAGAGERSAEATSSSTEISSVD
jgi:hypothetical protein